MFKFLKYSSLCFLVLLVVSCGGDIKNNKEKASSEVKKILDSNKNNKSDEELKALIIGSWTSTETVRGETIVFDEKGKYSGYDGREEYKGKWEISNHKINLSTGGLFWLDIKADTLLLDSTKYIKDHPGLS
jgi:hypothetical protein